jgi:hypothetical protein
VCRGNHSSMPYPLASWIPLQLHFIIIIIIIK